ncbi:hypothetical protein [Erythrobacter sp. BLCC-B19]|uniref:hypothetical protein n=1 Tax=Erythrobacter sp. BLCC-B19 TaxID=3025315 RepID=UPI00235E5801|nr:hypothetical protein [Erythrobacter sp. BLCC-B19]WDA40335.1 hypothetical protein PS060_12285 [Erythrobacter sp. BLCC-B19]
MKKSVLFVAISSVILQGCTTLKVHHFNEGKAPSRQGIAYFLPVTQFETKLSWTASCGENDKALTLTPKAEMTSATAADPDGLYVIDYASLDAFTKTSSVKVDFYDNGAIKSINASADDKTGELLTTSLTAVGALGRMMAFGDGRDGQKPIQLVCSAELIDALKKVKEAKSGKTLDGGRFVDGVDQKTDKLKAATQSLEAYGSVIIRAGASITDAQRNEHFRLINEVSAAQHELDGASKVLAEAQKGITYTKTILVSETKAGSAGAEEHMIDPDKLLKWIETDPLKYCSQDDKICAAAIKNVNFDDEAKKLATKNSLYLDLAVNSRFADRYTGGERGDAASGVRYRIAVPATLTVCAASKCSKPVVGGAPGDGGAAKANVVKAFPVQMMNADTTFFLPFKSAMFTNATLSATFSQSGVLTSAGYEQKRAQSDAAAGVVKTLLGEVETTIGQSRKADLNEVKRQEELAKAREALAKAKKGQADAEAALVEKTLDPNDEAIKALAASTALRKAETANSEAALAKLEAERRYAEATAPK